MEDSGVGAVACASKAAVDPQSKFVGMLSAYGLTDNDHT